MPIFTPEKTLLDLPRTPIILQTILHGVDQQRASSATDGPDGWNVIEIVGHLNDYDQIFLERTQTMIEGDAPALGSHDQDELVRQHGYKTQPLTDVLASFLSRRRAFIDYLSGLSAEQWQRTGVHPSWGAITVLDQAINVTHHDVNHIAQVIKALA